MKVLVSLFLSPALWVMVDGWTAIEVTNKTEEYEGQCNSQNKDVGLLKDGEEKQLEDLCVKVTCSITKEYAEVVYVGCGTISAGPPCKLIEGNLSNPYPECCPTAAC